MSASATPPDLALEPGRELPLPWRDVRLLQTPLSLLAVLDVALRSTGGLVEISDASQLSTILLAVVLLGVTLLRHDAVETRLAIATLCCVDLAMVGLSVLSDSGGTGLIALLPCLWLGATFGRTGAALAGVSSLLLVSLPGMAYADFSGASVAWGVSFPLVAGTAALAVAEGLASARRERLRAGRSARELDAARATLELETQRIGIVLDTAGVGLMLLDADGAIDYVNPLAKPMLQLGNPEAGVPTEEGLIFRADGVTPMPYDERPVSRVVAGDEFDDVRVWIGADSATRRLLSVSGRQIAPAGDAPQGGVVAFHDLTISERDLRLRATFLDTIAHELRTPLTSLDAYLHLLADVEDLPEEAAELLPALRRASERLRRLSAQLVSRAGQAPLPVHVEDVDVSSLVTRVCAGRRLSVAACRVHLDVHVAPRIRATVDPGHLARATEILLDRAIDAAPEDSVVRVAAVLAHGSVDISVADQGPGIDSSQHFTIFQPAAPAADGNEPAGPPSGLAYAQAAVVAQGGRIEVDSRLGAGALFIIRLPQHPGDRLAGSPVG